MRTIFLLGPPGSGKSSLGEAACRDLDLRFLDLTSPDMNRLPVEAQKERLNEALEKRVADVIALPWTLQRERQIHTWLRRYGMLLVLWAHPLEMQERSGRSEPLFTPAKRIKTKSGFGECGTGCLEYRSLDRSADALLKLVKTPFDEAAGELRNCLSWMNQLTDEPPMIQVGIDHWVDDWSQSFSINKDTTYSIVDAMARYIMYLRFQGKSSRKISAVRHDLQVAGILVLRHEAPGKIKRSSLHDLFATPREHEFMTVFTDSPSAIERYETNLRGFANFLKKSLASPDADDQAPSLKHKR